MILLFSLVSLKIFGGDTAAHSVDSVSVQGRVVESRDGHFGRVRLAEYAHVTQEHVVIADDVDRLAESTHHAALYHTLDRSVKLIEIVNEITWRINSVTHS